MEYFEIRWQKIEKFLHVVYNNLQEADKFSYNELREEVIDLCRNGF